MEFSRPKQVAFGNVIQLLYKLKATTRLHIPAVSNPWHLFDTRELPVELITAMRKAKR